MNQGKGVPTAGPLGFDMIWVNPRIMEEALSFSLFFCCELVTVVKHSVSHRAGRVTFFTLLSFKLAVEHSVLASSCWENTQHNVLCCCLCNLPILKGNFLLPHFPARQPVILAKYYGFFTLLIWLSLPPAWKVVSQNLHKTSMIREGRKYLHHCKQFDKCFFLCLYCSGLLGAALLSFWYKTFQWQVELCRFLEKVLSCLILTGF